MFALRSAHAATLAWHLSERMRAERVAIVHAHDPASARLAAFAAVRARVPVVTCSAYEPASADPQHGAGGMLGALALRLTRRVLCTCDAVRRSHAVRSPWAADRFVALPPGLSVAMPRPRAEVRAELGLLDRDRMVLAAGSLTAENAPHVLIEAFQRVSRRMSGARLFVAGSGPRREDLERRIADLGIGGRVRFLGDHADVASLMAAADACVHVPLRAGLPVSLVEALRAGLPAVASRVGGIPEVVADGTTGWLVPPG